MCVYIGSQVIWYWRLRAMSRSVHLSKDNIEAWEEFMRSVVKFLDQYRSLIDTYVLDFFTKDLWSKLNPKWRAVLERLTPLDLANFLLSDSPLKQKHVWPLSLQAFRATAFAYTLPRKPVTSADPFMNYFNQQMKVKPFLHTSQNSEMGCYDKGTSSVIKNFESGVTTKHNEELFTVQNEDSNSVMEVDVKCKDSAHCGLMQNVNYCETRQIRKTEESISRSICVEQLSSLRHLYQQQKAQKDTEKLINPIQQMTVSWGDAASELSAAAGQHKLLQHVFRRHLKPKKQHEIARLALIAGRIAQSVCDGVMIDVGSGQGHLSRLLAYGHNVRVVCLEAQDEFINGAKKFDSQLEIAVEKMKRKQTFLPALPPAPRHTVCHLEPDMNPQKFREVHWTSAHKILIFPLAMFGNGKIQDYLKEEELL